MMWENSHQFRNCGCIPGLHLAHVWRLQGCGCRSELLSRLSVARARGVAVPQDRTLSACGACQDAAAFRFNPFATSFPITRGRFIFCCTHSSFLYIHYKHAITVHAQVYGRGPGSRLVDRVDRERHDKVWYIDKPPRHTLANLDCRPSSHVLGTITGG
jgi:hypothetical protein